MLYNEEELFCTKIELLDFKITLPLAELSMGSSRLVSNVLIISDDILVNMQLVTFLMLSSIRELSIGEKTRWFWQPLSPLKYILPNKKSYSFSDICGLIC